MLFVRYRNKGIPVRYRNATVPDWDAGCRNTDASGIGLEDDAQLYGIGTGASVEIMG